MSEQQRVWAVQRVTAARWSCSKRCDTSLPSWSCGFDPRRPLSRPPHINPGRWQFSKCLSLTAVICCRRQLRARSRQNRGFQGSFQVAARRYFDRSLLRPVKRAIPASIRRFDPKLPDCLRSSAERSVKLWDTGTPWRGRYLGPDLDVGQPAEGSDMRGVSA